MGEDERRDVQRKKGEAEGKRCRPQLPLLHLPAGLFTARLSIGREYYLGVQYREGPHKDGRDSSPQV